MAFKREKRSSKWQNVQKDSGRSALVRECGTSRAEIVEGDRDRDYTVNLYKDGKYVTRKSSKTLRGIKALSSKKMRCSVRK